MTICESTDFMYPMLCDIYYPIITQNEYGQPNKNWVFDRTAVCNAAGFGGAGKEEIKPEVFLQYENMLICRVKTDLRISSNSSSNAITNILVSNIRNSSSEILYKETAGARAGKGTIYEVASLDPFIGLFGNIEYYKVLLRRSENQTAGD